MTIATFGSAASGILFATSSSFYVIDVAKSKAKPNVASFVMLLVINVSQLVSVMAKHLWPVMPFAVVSVLSCTLVSFFSLKNKNFYLEWPDKVGFVGAVLGLVLWFATKDPALNLYILSVVICVVFAPVIIKGFKRPDLETALPWHINFVASLFLLMTINSASVLVRLVPIRQIILSGLLNYGLIRQEFFKRKALNEV